jgi:glycosyltransferase involved in cell wall biosynthesis
MHTHLILYEPNIHNGGGLLLLNELLSAWPSTMLLRAFFDSRAQEKLTLPAKAEITWVKPSILSRLRAELEARRIGSHQDVSYLYFHGLPPILPMPGTVVVFLQNRLLFDASPLNGHPWFERLRLTAERWWMRALAHHGNRYIVQTKSMEAEVWRALAPHVRISVQPFIATMAVPLNSTIEAARPRYDFVYVANGCAHKNHKNLLLAWRLLAHAGLKPSLALTVDEQAYPALAQHIAEQYSEYGLNIFNLGAVAHANIAALYQSSSALIFPSKIESFGLPLLEAAQMGLPILAPELDYVRDVVEPAATFDPNSGVSIARAVRRFLKDPEALVKVGTARAFLAEVLK